MNLREHEEANSKTVGIKPVGVRVSPSAPLGRSGEIESQSQSTSETGAKPQRN